MKELENGIQNLSVLHCDGMGSESHPAPEPIGTAKYVERKGMNLTPPQTPRKRGVLTPLPHAWCLIPYGHNVTITVSGYGNVWLQDRRWCWGIQGTVAAGDWYIADMAL